MPRGGMAGHCGWAFTLDDGRIVCGSTENPDSKPWKPAGVDNGFWCKIVDDEEALREEMRRHVYDDYKTHAYEKTDPDLARKVADNCKQIGYSFTGNNCVDHAYEVLCHYGAVDLALPLDAPYPNAWFSSIAWERHSLKEEDR